MTEVEQYDEGQVAEHILAGHYDEGLTVIFEALRSRQRIAQQMKAARVAAQLRPKDKVRVTSGLKPKYLIGLEVTVDRIEGTRAYVTMPDIGAGRYSGKSNIGLPLSCVEKVA